MSRFQALLSSDAPVMTVELPPLNTVDPEAVARQVEPVLGFADAINVVDNSAARPHPSPVAVAALVKRHGGEPIMHLTCRDRNRLALQSELLGAAMLGVENLLCLTGDDVSAGDEPEAKRVFDLDSPQLLALGRLLNSGHYLSGRKLDQPPDFFLGAAENPGAPPHEYRADRALKKARAGASFFQLQIVFEMELLRRFMARAVRNGLTRSAAVLPTICVPRSAAGFRFVRDKVPGVSVPRSLIGRIEPYPAASQPEACLEIAVELAEATLALPGVRGLHVVSFQGPGAIRSLREVVDRSRPREPVPVA
jgi:methylenetetrahydrofolate reductase (NADPH)